MYERNLKLILAWPSDVAVFGGIARDGGLGSTMYPSSSKGGNCIFESGFVVIGRHMNSGVSWSRHRIGDGSVMALSLRFV